MYTWDMTKKYLTDHDWIAGGLAASVFCSNVYLAGKSIFGTTQAITQSFVDTVKGKRQPSIAEQLRPKLTFACKLLGFLVDGFALGPTIVIWGEFFDGNQAEEDYFPSAMSGAIFLLLYTASLSSIDDYVTFYLSHRGTEDEKEIIELVRKFNKLASLVENTSLLETAAFLAELPEEKKSALMQRFELTQERLEQYLSEREEKRKLLA
jgi:hypothetical protein